ncbi:acyltransferase family protein [Bacillus sp. 2205SS5-2]|uniref:acyltransferase family protein n=1 Tax=Bacillus sp. 2205SS5-2 TaxID=3109031 RepID=UPI0030068B7F
MKTSRDPFLDNSRFLLVLIVVFGHLISPFKENHEFIYSLNNFLSSFRMPALIMITGFFSKKFYKAGYIEKITIRLLIPFLIFQFFYKYNASLSINWFSPSFGLWFLLSVYSWNLLLFVFTRLKQPIIFSIIIGVGIGLVDSAGHYISVSRTFFFFPFFLMGYYADQAHVEWIKTSKAKMVSIFSITFSIFLLSPELFIEFLIIATNAYLTGFLLDHTCMK